jgi:calcineurin-like phosphoesterase family protein
MSEIFFISDTHFGHRGIIEFSGTKEFRKFNSIEEHDAELVKRWNSVVTKRDTVWHLGDVCFGARNLHILEQLNGYKKLVLGNHDIYATEEYLKYFARVYGCYEFKGMLLSHMPVAPSQFSRYYLNVHGHLHAKTLTAVDKRYINVSCEQINLTPISLDIIYSAWAARN